MHTDKAWEKWGEKDPYFGVYTEDKFRTNNLTPEIKQTFFDSGEQYIQHVLYTIRQKIHSDFSPNSALDFGCGTGRLIFPLAKICKRVVGVDISASMLAEAQKNLEAYPHVLLLKSDDQLSAIEAHRFDFVNTFIVLQHISKERVLRIFKKLVQSINKNGVGVIHLTYAKIKFSKNFGTPSNTIAFHLKTLAVALKKRIAGIFDSKKDPEMQMNLHSLNQLLFILQDAGVQNIFTEFTNHDGALGITLYFRI